MSNEMKCPVCQRLSGHKMDCPNRAGAPRSPVPVRPVLAANRVRTLRSHALDEALRLAQNVAPHRRSLPTGDEVVENAEKFLAFLDPPATERTEIRAFGQKNSLATDERPAEDEEDSTDE